MIIIKSLYIKKNTYHRQFDSNTSLALLNKNGSPLRREPQL